jgi:large subunit ribosomal protein L25
MADAVKIQAEARDPQKNKGTGSRVARRLRAQGRIPAIIYGHKQAVVPISLSRDSVWEMIKKSTHLAELVLGDTTEIALVREVQWDHLGKEILHLDFGRVSADEAIETEVRIDVRGIAPGIAEGGILEQLVHSVRVTCRANAIPDAIKIDVNNLHLNEAVHVKDLTGLPEGLKIVDADDDLLLVHVTSRAAAAEPAPSEAEAPVQPEVIKPERREKEE